MSNVRKLTLSAFLVALAYVLHRFPIFELANGGEISLGFEACLILIPFMCGNLWGILSSLVFAFLIIIDGVSAPPVTELASFITCIMLDYVIAFVILGFARVISKNMIIGGIIVIFIKFLAHTISGCIIWESLPLASIIYNGSYMLPELAICTIVLALLENRVRGYRQ